MLHQVVSTLRVASTEPRPRGRGNLVTWNIDVDDTSGFNGAAPARARKYSLFRPGQCAYRRFNGAAPARARKFVNCARGVL